MKPLVTQSEILNHWGYTMIWQFRMKFLLNGYPPYIDLNQVLQCLGQQRTPELQFDSHPYYEDCWRYAVTGIVGWFKEVAAGDGTWKGANRKIPPVGTVHELVAFTIMMSLSRTAMDSSTRPLWDLIDVEFLTLGGPEPKVWRGALWTSKA
jgi:hypothetical protein